MRRLVTLAFIAFALTPGTLSAQTQRPYAGLETRPIKALSAEQIDDLKAGRGMGLALAAELNGYPGPLHVLELAEPLGLSDAQRAKVKELFAAMKAETVPLGEKLLAQEADLDRKFSDRTITEAGLSSSLRAIGGTQAALRAAHLKYHLSTTKLLTAGQIQHYAVLRGYTNAQQIEHRPGGHRH